MPMKRVKPGTLPRFPRRDTLKELYEEQQAKIDKDKAIKNWDAPANRDDAGKFSPQLMQPEEPKDERENIRAPWRQRKTENISAPFSGPRPDGYWGKDASWRQLSPYQQAAAMALLEADAKGGKIDFNGAKNALGAMINRADKEGQDLGDHVSRKIYQPTIEPAQYARLQTIVSMSEFKALTELAEQRATGQVGDWVNGATHFLAKPQTMLALEAKEPDKYKSWRKWTGFDQETGRYKDEVLTDNSHVFLAPEGRHSAGGGTPNYGAVAELSGPPSALTPSPEPTSDPTSGQTPELPKLADLFGLPTSRKKPPGPAVNPMEDLQSKPFSMAGFEPPPEQDDASFALLPAQQRRAPQPGQPTLPVPRRPPGYSRPS